MYTCQQESLQIQIGLSNGVLFNGGRCMAAFQRCSFTVLYIPLTGFYLGGGGTLGMVPPLSRKVPPQNKNMQA